MLPSKSQFAFEESAKQLFAVYPHIYFWTFTFVKVPWCDRIAMIRWHGLMMRLTREYPFLRGLRVCELHASHGIHLHAIINVRVDINVMNRIKQGYGFGRLSVKKADIGGVTYLSKYLTKSFIDQNPSFAFRRRWGTIGGFKYTRCRDVEYDTALTRNHKLLFASLQIGYREYLVLGSFSRAFGDFSDWPLSKKVNFQTIMQSYGHKKRFI